MLVSWGSTFVDIIVSSLSSELSDEFGGGMKYFARELCLFFVVVFVEDALLLLFVGLRFLFFVIVFLFFAGRPHRFRFFTLWKCRLIIFSNGGDRTIDCPVVTYKKNKDLGRTTRKSKNSRNEWWMGTMKQRSEPVGARSLISLILLG